MRYPTPTPSPRPPGLRDLSDEDEVTLDEARKEHALDLKGASDEGYARGRKDGYDTGYEEGRTAALKMAGQQTSGIPGWLTVVSVLSLLTIVPFLLGLFLGLFLVQLIS